MPERVHPFQLHLPGFAGPLSELLQLVTRRELDVDTLSLGDITSQYAEHLEAERAPDLDQTGEFLRTAARLLVLKSALLVSAEGAVEGDEVVTREEPEPVLERERLSRAVLFLQHSDGESFAGAGREHHIVRPVEPRPVSSLVRALVDLGARSEDDEVRVTPPPFVRLETTLSQLLRRVRSGTRISLLRLLRGGCRADAVMHFVATLELVRRRAATVTQVEPFGDISIAPAEPGADAGQQAV